MLFLSWSDEKEQKAELRLDLFEAAVEAGAIVPGKPGESAAITRITSTDPDEIMPPPESKITLTPEEIKTLERWVSEGAEYQQHWAFVPLPDTVVVPASDKNWGENPIDAFVLAGLRDKGVVPAGEAAPEKWLRRVTFDLTGLPPTLEEIDTFLADTADGTYGRAVDRLLASSAYGERMAGDWMDAARYADTFGYQADRTMKMWPWRDWVIKAFNENLSYDRFLTWQIAGDLLENPTGEQYLATAFNRLHRQTNEGGSVEEEFRVEYVSDRIHTIGTAMLGLTLECSRCHDHKYDPISQKDYYEMTSFFDNIDESGLYSHFTAAVPSPALLLWKGEDKAKWLETKEMIREMEGELAAIGAQGHIGEAVTVPVPVASYPLDDGGSPGKIGGAKTFDGDRGFVCKDAEEKTSVGDFSRARPFSFSLWVKPAEHRSRTVLFHRSRAAEDSAFRGYGLTLDEGIPTFTLAHFWPGNALRVRAAAGKLPLGEWSHLTVTYSGSSRAGGVKIYIGGVAAPLEVVRDNLYKDIQHRKNWGDGDSDKIRLELAARFRDIGFKGGTIDEFQVFTTELTALEVAQLAGTGVEHGSADIDAHRLARLTPAYTAALTELQKLRDKENDLISKVTEIMVMRETPEERQTYILDRGVYDAKGEPVRSGIPERIFPYGEELSRNRLGFARWMTDPRHPLTARVAVNRFWQNFFGRGLVGTTEDFGSQGNLPTHPGLLDWLSREFISSGWDVKALCKLITTSATYRQSSVPYDRGLLVRDPDNQFLARGPKHRLPAEQIRDNALASSGLLVRKVGGASVMPYQPAGLWKESGTGEIYKQGKGDALYRRSMYTFWKRTAPPPSMLVFDATSREVCTVKREQTASPQQALVLLNDPQFVEASRVLAERLIKNSPEDPSARVTEAFRILTGRVPTGKESAILNRLYAEQKAHYATVPEEAQAFLSTGEAPRDKTLDPADHAATTVVVNALFNFDECVTKR